VPAVVRYRRGPDPTIVLPRRVALALRPEDDREVIPVRVTLNKNAPPFAGELREEQSSQPVKNFAVDAQVTLATLRRPWSYVGWAVDPGNAGAGLTAQLRILTRGLDAYTAPVVIPAGRPFALVGLIVGATCELVVTNGTAGVVRNLRGSIWGMSER
jgi:hypothetical protein